MNAPLFPLYLPQVATQELPAYAEEPLFLEDPQRVFSRLSQMDWAFTEDETSFLGHDIHPYPAKFIPQIPGSLISLLSSPGELIFDPFGGSGTTALEAVRLGRRALSIDANPLSALIGRVKATQIGRAAFRELLGFQAALSSELQSISSVEDLIVKYGAHAPDIPNRDKWFADTAFSELCLIKARISELEVQEARDVALVALSRIAIRASFQDSETRYKSVPREVPAGETLQRYLREFRSVIDAVGQSEPAIRYGLSKFVSADIRRVDPSIVEDCSVDFIATSPPYGNATDYHLYHRFRLLWLGFDPGQLGKVEIGSHLKHQREDSGFESYYADLGAAVRTMERVLRPSRYAALVLGDSVYKGRTYDPAMFLSRDFKTMGFDALHIIERPIHNIKRSFAHAGRRATSERIVILRKSATKAKMRLAPPPYRLWHYEKILRLKELDNGTANLSAAEKPLEGPSSPNAILSYRRLALTHKLSSANFADEPTWQAVLENGGATNPAARKDPKYVTHGLHSYKGKFYPQLAKALLNDARVNLGSVLLDPFCGSGTTLLEGYLNGYSARGCDMNPLAAKIARGKTEILETNPDLLNEAVTTILDVIDAAPKRFPLEMSEFDELCHEEIQRWFPKKVVGKLNWLLRQIRKNSAGPVCNFLEVVFSSIVREVSQQDPSDLRIRYRKDLLEDADVLGLFVKQIELQVGRVEKFWRVRGWAPSRFYSSQAINADNRACDTYGQLDLVPSSVDIVLTSPPYATALPYIDTDRLSLLLLFGIDSSRRRPLEENLIGSREIGVAARKHIENALESLTLPVASSFLTKLLRLLAKDDSAGFRKQNMPALIARYVSDMDAVFRNLAVVCKQGAPAMFVVGDNKMEVGGKVIRIPTIDLVSEVAQSNGYEEVSRLDISVTTENMLHQKNAITENAVLCFKRV